MKNQILETALNQFLKFGIREMSIQKLVEPLGISTKTVYKFFENKELLLEEALHLYYDQHFELLKDLSTSRNPIQLLIDIWYVAVEREYKVNNIFFEDLQHYYPEVKQKTEVAVSKKFTNQFVAIIEQGINEGLIRTDIIPALVQRTIYVLYEAIARENRFKDFDNPPLEILMNTVILYLRGVCTLNGMGELDAHVSTLQSFGKSTKTKYRKKPAQRS